MANEPNWRQLCVNFHLAVLAVDSATREMNSAQSGMNSVSARACAIQAGAEAAESEMAIHNAVEVWLHSDGES